MKLRDAQRFCKRHNCGCGNSLSYKPIGNGQVEVICPGNPEHKQFVTMPTLTEQYKRGDALHPAISNRISKRIGGYMDSTALMQISPDQMQAQIVQAQKAFGFALDQYGQSRALQPAELHLLAHYCRTYGFDPFKGEVVLFQGRPFVMIDGLRRKAHETGCYAGARFEAVRNEDKESMGYAVGDIVFKAIVKKIVSGMACEFEGYGGIRQAEVDAKSQKGGARHPVINRYPSEMAQNRAEKRALRMAFQFSYPDVDLDEGAIDAEYTVLQEQPAQSPAKQEKARPSASQSLPEPPPDDKPPLEELSTPASRPQDHKPSVTSEQFSELVGTLDYDKASMEKALGVTQAKPWKGNRAEALDILFAKRQSDGKIDPSVRHWQELLSG